MKITNCEIMSGNTLVALWRDEKFQIINLDLLPQYLKRLPDVNLWLKSRAIDSNRMNSMLLKKALRLREKDDISTVLYVNAATITDNYWIRPIGSKISYQEIQFTNDDFSNLALKGSYNSFNWASNRKNKKTPELTNIGSFEKCWKLKDGKWWIYKKASHDEMFSELFVYQLGKILDMNMAYYEKGKGFIKTLDFTDSKVNFEPAFSFMGDNIKYEDVANSLEKLCPDAIQDYIQMIFMDTVCANPDRHANNFGLLRDQNTGKWLGLAPNFDNNMALISHGYPSNPKANDILISLFNEFLNSHPQYKKYIPTITEYTVRKVLDTLNMRVKSQQIVDLVMNRYGQLIL